MTREHQCPECGETFDWDGLAGHVMDEHGYLESDVELLSLEVDV